MVGNREGIFLVEMDATGLPGVCRLGGRWRLNEVVESRVFAQNSERMEKVERRGVFLGMVFGIDWKVSLGKNGI